MAISDFFGRIFSRQANTAPGEMTKIFPPNQNAEVRYNYLVAEIDSIRTGIGDTDQEKAILNVIDRIIAKPRFVWCDLYTLERCIIKILPLEQLQRRAWNLRDTYRVDVGEQAYEVYQRSNPPDPADPSKEKEVRADMLELCKELHWLYAITPVREGIRNKISTRISIGLTLFFLVLLACVASDIYEKTTLSFFAFVLFMGAIGASVSLQQRIQSLPTSGDAILNILSLENGSASVYLSPISGAVFAFLAYLLFVGGYIKGDLFPNLPGTPRVATVSAAPVVGAVANPSAAAEVKPAVTPTSNATGVESSQTDNPTTSGEQIPVVKLLRSSEPATSSELAKLLIWCFLAGFAERLVPDTLNRLITRKIAVMTDTTTRTVLPAPEPPVPATPPVATTGPVQPAAQGG